MNDRYRACWSGRGRWLLTAALTAAASAGPPPLAFPVRGQNPYTAPIATVLDHAAADFYDPNSASVLAYTGELAAGASGRKAPYGYFHERAGSPKPLPFLINGAYVGTGVDGPAVLNYAGHAGYDYRYGPGTIIVAAADGKTYIPARDAIYGRAGDPWCALHAFYIDHGGGWSTWYLHAERLLVNGGRLANGAPPHACPNGINSRIDRDEALGAVKRGDPVALVGGFAHGRARGVGYHLHFEVRRDCIPMEGGVVRIHGCRVMDPYGWEGLTADPYVGSASQAAPHNLLAVPQATPVWDLAALGTALPVVTAVNLTATAEAFELTISGAGFVRGATITLWRKGDGSYAGRVTPRRLSATSILATLPRRFRREIGELVLKVGNPGGPRSRAALLTHNLPRTRR